MTTTTKRSAVQRQRQAAEAAAELAAQNTLDYISGMTNDATHIMVGWLVSHIAHTGGATLDEVRRAADAGREMYPDVTR